jgi:hypothetical protein
MFVTRIGIIQGFADDMLNFVILNAITARTNGLEVLEHQRGNKGCPKLNFLQKDWEKGTKLEVWLVTYYTIWPPRSRT